MILIQLTGLSGSGKTTLANNVKIELETRGHRVEVLDGDEFRSTLCKDLGFSRDDRIENIRRLGVIGGVLARNGIITLVAAVNPYEEGRREIRSCGANVKTVWVDCDLETLQKRDTKGLYRRALLPDDHPDKLHNLTGVNDPFDTPEDTDLIIRTNEESVVDSTARLTGFVLQSLDDVKHARPKALFIGRWQPFHNGHKWLIEQKLGKGVPVLIAVRNVEPDENNPLRTDETVAMLRTLYEGHDVEVITIPNIESVNFGRTVGYEINEFTPPPDIHGISATEIRNSINNGADNWKEHVDEKLHDLVVKYLG